MNIQEIEAGRELDARVAERVMDNPPSYYQCPHFDYKGRMLSFCSCPELPHYSTDIAAAYQMEERIKELGLESEYSEALLDLTDASEHFELIHATPEDRCRAALAAAYWR